MRGITAILGTALVGAGLIFASNAAMAETARDIRLPLPKQAPGSIERIEKLRQKYEGVWSRYLEKSVGKSASYLPPSQIDPRFTMAFYVNAKGKGPFAQRMWVLQRDAVGGPWQLAMWDKRYWRRQALPAGVTPPYSWKVSTGRKYYGDPRSGPTPLGVFALDERKYRMARGYTAPGMINVMYIDYHYRSGRRSGVAFHGTTRSRYRRLGRIDSHGCIRMTQPNALALLNRLQGRDGVLAEELRWGRVPRFWKHQRGGNRFGYTRNGRMHQIPAAPKAVLGAPSSRGGELAALRQASFRPEDAEAERGASPNVLTKTGYRALTVIFKD